MQRRVGDVFIESVAAESPKFSAQMVLVHGLWCTAVAWRKFMGYLAHRGWTCHALTLRRRVGDAPPRFADYVADVRAVIAACEAPPVLLGHDLGGLLALFAGPSAVQAIATLAPIIPRAHAVTAHPALSGWRAYLGQLQRRLPAPRAQLGRVYFAGTAPGGSVADSALIARELRAAEFRVPEVRSVPALLLAGGRDPFCPPHAVEQLAAHCGASFHCAEEAGHAMPWEPGWERRVAEVHRWLVHTLGDSLLLMRDEEE